MKARARIDLADQTHGGLAGPLPSPRQSLILRVEPEQQPVDFGVRIATPGGDPIAPGTNYEAVELWFWADLANVFVVPSIRFTLRYPARVVGTGQVLEVLPF